MRIRLKHIVVLITILSFCAIGLGFYLIDSNTNTAHKLIGSGTAGLFLIAMPIFLYKESKRRKVQDYMLTEENIRKMQEKGPKKSENQ